MEGTRWAGGLPDSTAQGRAAQQLHVLPRVQQHRQAPSSSRHSAPSRRAGNQAKQHRQAPSSSQQPALAPQAGGQAAKRTCCAPASCIASPKWALTRSKCSLHRPAQPGCSEQAELERAASSREQPWATAAQPRREARHAAALQRVLVPPVRWLLVHCCLASALRAAHHTCASAPRARCTERARAAG